MARFRTAPDSHDPSPSPGRKGRFRSAPASDARSLRTPGTSLRLGLCLLLAAATFAVYAQVLGHDFMLYDDRDYVTENAHVRAGLGLSGLRWAFTSGQASNCAAFAKLGL